MNFIKKKLLKWQAFSVLWVVAVGSLLHFTYEWSGESIVVGAFSPVNESVWEHLKMGYWSMIFFCFIEYPFIKDYANNYFFAKAVGIFVMNLFIVLSYYSYTALIGKHLLICDIIIYVIGALIYGILSYKIMINSSSTNLNKLGLFMLVLFGFLFVLFTYFTPRLPIFKDPSGGYGI